MDKVFLLFSLFLAFTTVQCYNLEAFEDYGFEALDTTYNLEASIGEACTNKTNCTIACNNVQNCTDTVDLDCCGSFCVDKNTNTQHCGACGTKATVCIGGSPITFPTVNVNQVQQLPSIVNIPGDPTNITTFTFYKIPNDEANTPTNEYTFTCRTTVGTTPQGGNAISVHLGYEVQGTTQLIQVWPSEAFSQFTSSQPQTAELKFSVVRPANLAQPTCITAIVVRNTATTKRDIFAFSSLETVSQTVVFSSFSATTADCTGAGAGIVACNGRCVDTLNDLDNCGQCNPTKPPTTGFSVVVACLNGVSYQVGKLPFGTLPTDIPLSVPFGRVLREFTLTQTSGSAVGLAHAPNSGPLPVPYQLKCAFEFQLLSPNEAQFFLGSQLGNQPLQLLNVPSSGIVDVASPTGTPIQKISRTFDIPANGPMPKCVLVSQTGQTESTRTGDIRIRVLSVESSVSTKEKTGSKTTISVEFGGAVRIQPREP